MLKILITGGRGMLAHDFIELFSLSYTLVALDSNELNIVDFHAIEKKVSEIQPDIILNCAAYTQVDDAEKIGMQKNYEVNSIGVYNLAKISDEKDIDFITISSDYVFAGETKIGSHEQDLEQPLNHYGMAKYLGEKLAMNENENSIVIRTSWLYGGGSDYKNFVNTMLKLGAKLDKLQVIHDQYGNPTSAQDLSRALSQLIQNIGQYRGKIFHFSNATENNGITWYDFAQEIFHQKDIAIDLIACTSAEFTTQASRPHYSKLINTSDIQLRDWKEGLKEYLDSL